MPSPTPAALLAALALLAPTKAQAPLAIHEWGTFTVLQDEDGRAIGGINADDEPVPEFVHGLARELLIPPTELAQGFFQGAPRCHPEVTLRLETPVTYFHPPAGSALPLTLDVEVAFLGGWLTEYWPDAAARAPGAPLGHLDPEQAGELAWRGLTVGGDAPGPATEAPVWLAPRRVAAAPVESASGEAERFLFYRGVGCRDAPLRVVRRGDQLVVRAQPPAGLGPLRVTRAWLADVLADGQTAWRTLPGLELAGQSELARVPAAFAAADYAHEHQDALRADMRAALLEDGLHADEAQALLDTWKLSYFESSGLRLLFLVPRAFTDWILPLRTSVDAELQRTMVGRIELVTPRQRALLATIAAGPTSDRGWFDAWSKPLLEKDGGRAFLDAWSKLASGAARLADLGIAVPADYRAYLDLGRFRGALLLDEQARRPAAALAAFIAAYGLDAYAPG